MLSSESILGKIGEGETATETVMYVAPFHYEMEHLKTDVLHDFVSCRDLLDRHTVSLEELLPLVEGLRSAISSFAGKEGTDCADIHEAIQIDADTKEKMRVLERRAAEIRESMSELFERI
jgi:hypothetical protein